MQLAWLLACAVGIAALLFFTFSASSQFAIGKRARRIGGIGFTLSIVAIWLLGLPRGDSRLTVIMVLGTECLILLVIGIVSRIQLKFHQWDRFDDATMYRIRNQPTGDV